MKTETAEWDIEEFLDFLQLEINEVELEGVIVPEEGGRMPCDFTLWDNEANNPVLVMEHENEEKKLTDNLDKLLKERDVQERLLIGYTNQNRSELIATLKKYKEGTNCNLTVYVLLGKDKPDGMCKFKLEKI